MSEERTIVSPLIKMEITMRLILKFALTCFGVLILPGCSIFIEDCTKHANDPEAYRQCSASQGDSQAQYELGLEAYEQQDYKTALKWLKLAAASDSGRTAVYMPPAGGQKYGTVMMMDTGQGTAGHSGAQRLLADMYDRGLGVRADHDLARRYRDMAGKVTSREY